MGGRRPLARARHLRTILDTLRREVGLERMETLVPPACRQALQDSSSVDWLDLAHAEVLVRAVYDELGGERADALFRKQAAAMARGPLLAPLIGAALRVLRPDPGGISRWFPKVWDLVFRDCGRWEHAVVGERAVELVLADRPAGWDRDEVWPRSTRAALLALLDVTRSSGQVEARTTSDARAAPAFRITWSPRE